MIERRTTNQETMGNPDVAQRVSFGARHIQVALCYLGLANYGMQFASLSVALVGMADPDPSTGPTLNYTLSNEGTISGLFIYGVTMGMIPVGYLISFYNPVQLMCTLSGILCGILTLFHPYVAVHYGFVTACILRVLVGMTQSFILSGLYVHLSQWIVSQEQEKFSFVWGGSGMGCAVITGVGGILISRAGGWEAVFYVCGCYSVVWGIVCWVWGAESPDKHTTISPIEKEFLQSNISIERKGKIKWREILTSAPVWALLITRASENWSGLTMSSLGPTFYNKLLDLSVEKIAYINVGLDIIMFIVSIGFAYFANKLAKYVTTNVSRKLWNTIGLCGSAIPLLLLYLAKDDAVFVISLVFVYYILGLARQPGHMTNCFEVAPSYSGVISSLMMFFSNLIGFTGPILTGIIVKNERDPEDWWNVWCIGALLNVFGAVVFLIFGTTKVQPWNDD